MWVSCWVARTVHSEGDLNEELIAIGEVPGFLILRLAHDLFCTYDQILLLSSTSLMI
jgi:hypothetical protein